MAKRRKPGDIPGIPKTAVDDEGYQTDGMYRWGLPPKPLSESQFQHWIDEFNAEYQKTAIERIHEMRDYLTKLVAPHLEGPYSKMGEIVHARTHVYLELSTGAGCYILKPWVPKGSYLSDAMDALSELRELELLVNSPPRKLDLVVRHALRVGAMVTRADLRRRFGPAVLKAQSHRKASARGGTKSRVFTPEVRKIAEPMFLRFKRGGLSDYDASVRTAAKLKAEHSVEISARTIKRNLSK